MEGCVGKYHYFLKKDVQEKIHSDKIKFEYLRASLQVAPSTLRRALTQKYKLRGDLIVRLADCIQMEPKAMVICPICQEAKL